MIGIVSYGVGNIRSVSNALDWLGYPWQLAENKGDFAKVTALILPGVGAFRTAMDQLAKAGLIEVLQDWSVKGRPLLGICLGMQLLGRRSEEGGDHRGLGVVPADVLRIPKADGIRIPHIGWNTVTRVRESALWGELGSAVCYHVHSYAMFFSEDVAGEWVVGNVVHGQALPSMIHHDNVMGTQFHPEKSQHDGLQILGNFLKFAATC